MQVYCVLCGEPIRISDDRLETNFRFGVPIEPQHVVCYVCWVDAQTSETLEDFRDGLHDRRYVAEHLREVLRDLRRARRPEADDAR